LGEQGGVAVFLSLGPAAGIDAPAVANDQHYGPRHGSIVGRMAAGSKPPSRKASADAEALARQDGVLREQGAQRGEIEDCDGETPPLQQEK
jgi:hypothetical protein